MHTSSDARLFAAANFSRPYWLFRTSFANLLRLWSQWLYNYLSSRNDFMNSRIGLNSRIKIWSRQLRNRRWVCALQSASISELRIFLFQRTQCSIFYGCMTPMLQISGQLILCEHLSRADGDRTVIRRERSCSKSAWRIE